MFSSGLIKNFPVKRLITDEERARQLKQQDRINLEPADQLSVIKVNSTYLEVVDKFYTYKGWFTMLAVLIGLIMFSFMMYIIIDALASADPMLKQFVFVFVIFGFIPFYSLCYWLFRKESYRYTHWPVRFNRKTRMVHVFLMDGRQASVAWKDVFFEIAPGFMPGDKKTWNLHGHILKQDGKTVVATFGIMDSGVGEDEKEITLRQWELIRRYMEEDHVAIINHIKECMPIGDKRETWPVAWNRLMVIAELPNVYLKFGLTIIMAIQTPFRMLAMHTSKLPVWNARIEAENVIDPNDPYIKDSRINPEGLR